MVISLGNSTLAVLKKGTNTISRIVGRAQWHFKPQRTRVIGENGHMLPRGGHGSSFSVSLVKVLCASVRRPSIASFSSCSILSTKIIGKHATCFLSSHRCPPLCKMELGTCCGFHRPFLRVCVCHPHLLIRRLKGHSVKLCHNA